jgi:hypothetical protein
MNYSIRPARSRNRKKKKGNTPMKGRACFESRKTSLLTRPGFRGLILSDGKRKPTLDFKHQIENCDRPKKTKKTRRLQHRLQLGIPPSCEAGRTVDHVPILGKWSQSSIRRKNSKEKGSKGGGGGRLCSLPREVFSKSDTLFKHSCSPFHNFPFPTTNFGYVLRQSKRP